MMRSVDWQVEVAALERSRLRVIAACHARDNKLIFCAVRDAILEVTSTSNWVYVGQVQEWGGKLYRACGKAWLQLDTGRPLGKLKRRLLVSRLERMGLPPQMPEL